MGCLLPSARRANPSCKSALEQLVSSELIFVRGAPPEATYTFKHALVRDAAYASLLKSRRQELHARIAAILEEGYPDVATRQPELIAHHLSEARLQSELSVLAARRRQCSTSTGASGGNGAFLPRPCDGASDPATRSNENSMSCGCWCELGNSAAGAKGWGAAEVGKALYRARDLCAEAGDDSLLHPILEGLFGFHMTHAELRTAEKFGLELLRLGEARNETGPAGSTATRRC